MLLSDDIILNGGRAIAKSYAKINLTLDVLGRMENGYHEIEMVMQTVNLFDLVIVDRQEHGIRVSTNLRYLPNNEKNIAYKACMEFFAYTKRQGGAKILIHKNIPVAAGLAGGSGNGAAVLCALDLLYGTRLTLEELCMLGQRLGADVPYCITGGTQLAKGIGEQLTPLPPLPKTTVLLVKPPINVSTPAIYAQMDAAPIPERPDKAAMLAALAAGDVPAVSGLLCNVMEQVTQAQFPVIGGIKKKLLLNGALGASMSGSGPTVFGFFLDDAAAKRSADSFSTMYKDVFLTKTIQ